jgi:hypothetical protein
MLEVIRKEILYNRTNNIQDKYQCTICDFITKSFVSMTQHEELHKKYNAIITRNEKGLLYGCSNCNKKFGWTNKKRFINHVQNKCKAINGGSK